jgi:outer membrane protein assembly factor BamB
MRNSVSAAWVLILSLSSVIRGAEPDWPQWRGPKRDDVSTETGLLKKWPKDGPQVVWKAEGIGSGYSSITITGNRVFTVGNKGGKSYLVCLDRKEGQKEWSAEVGSAGGNLGSTPTVDGDRVYAIGQGGDLVCVDVQSGEVKWRKHFKKDFRGECGGWHYTESPLVDGERLVCTPGAKDAIIVAFDKKTGEIIWKSKANVRDATAGYSSIVIAEVGGIKMYVQLVAAGVIGVAAKDGKPLWKYERLGGTTANIPTPIVLGNQLFCCAGYDQGGALLTLSVEDGKVNFKEEYFNHELKNKHGGVLVVNNRVYGDSDDSGSPFCANVKTGKVLWRKKERSQGHGSAAVTYADGHLYVLYENGYMVLVDANADEYKEVGSFKVPGGGGPSWAHPVVLGGKLYVRNGATLICYDIKQN